jgi:4-hydroxybenzoate polyprenyltransferase
MPTSAIASQARRAPAVRYLSCLRPAEILVLQGPPLLGAAFALGPQVADHAASLALLAAANVCLVAHVFVVNDWSNLPADLSDPNKTARVFTASGVRRGQMGRLAIALLAAGLVFCGVLGPTVLGLALGIAVCSTLYSAPAFDWKGTPFLNSVAHLAGGTLHFLLGYAIGGAIDTRGLAVATFFALVFAAGHLTQEVRDHRGDVRNGIRTNAVAFGPRRAFAASLVLFTLAQVILAALALSSAIPTVLAVVVLFHPLHLRWALDARADGFSYASISRLQTRYRVLYAAVGVAMVAALWGR